MPTGERVNFEAAVNFLDYIWEISKFDKENSCYYYTYPQAKNKFGGNQLHEAAKLAKIARKRTNGCGFALHFTDGKHITRIDYENLWAAYKLLREERRLKYSETTDIEPKPSQEPLTQPDEEKQEEFTFTKRKTEPDYNRKPDNRQTEQTEKLLLLKQEADEYGIQYHPNIGYETLQERIDTYLAGLNKIDKEHRLNVRAWEDVVNGTQQSIKDSIVFQEAVKAEIALRKQKMLSKLGLFTTGVIVGLILVIIYQVLLS